MTARLRASSSRSKARLSAGIAGQPGGVVNASRATLRPRRRFVTVTVKRRDPLAAPSWGQTVRSGAIATS